MKGQKNKDLYGLQDEINDQICVRILRIRRLLEILSPAVLLDHSRASLESVTKLNYVTMRRTAHNVPCKHNSSGCIQLKRCHGPYSIGFYGFGKLFITRPNIQLNESLYLARFTSASTFFANVKLE